jgi:hypothetical protein
MKSISRNETRPRSCVRHGLHSSTALLNEGFDAIEDPLQAELEGMVGVGNGLVVLASGRADPRSHRIALRVQHLGEPRSCDCPPGRIVHATAAHDV